MLFRSALVLAHATNNLLNDLTDHLKGVDKNNYFRAIYGPHALEHQMLSVRGLLAYAAFSGVIALAIGAYLVSVRGPLALALLAAGAVFVLVRNCGVTLRSISASTSSFCRSRFKSISKSLTD